MITEHTICALPVTHPDWRQLAIKVQRRINGMWVLNWGGYYQSSNPDADDDNWYPGLGDAIGYDEQTALHFAELLKAQVDVNGLTAADLLSGDER